VDSESDPGCDEASLHAATTSAPQGPAPHVPVFLDEILDQLGGQPLRIFADGTLGAGGHSIAILQSHPECTLLIGGDQDPSALQLASERLRPVLQSQITEFQPVHTNYADLPGYLMRQGIRPDAILLDLGVSSMQLDQPERGFSFQAEGPLDMRMNPTQGPTAAQLCMSWSEQELRELFWKLGEEPRGRAAARAIVEARRKHPLRTTKDLVDVLTPVLKRQGPTHPATRVFQALRMAVNDELGVLERSLGPLAASLAPGGRLLVITFHSLEDRVVKFAFRDLAKTGPYSILTKKPLEPSVEEVRRNRRARSAKLRVIQRHLDEHPASLGS
jgi:16S rRNA (cytosine1402-N4)-methyltransferase